MPGRKVTLYQCIVLVGQLLEIVPNPSVALARALVNLFTQSTAEAAEAAKASKSLRSKHSNNLIKKKKI